jgi:hypothetical protein
MKTIVLTVITAALASPVTLAAQDQDGRLARIRQAFPAEAVERIEMIVADARAADVPVAALLDKALEGAAKRVPADRVVAALSTYSARLAEARELIGQGRAPGDVVAAADALGRGIPASTIRDLAGVREGDMAIPTVVLGDLVAAGVPVEFAYGVVEAALAEGSVDEQLLAVPSAVRRLIREGRLPAEAASAVTSAFSQGRLPVGVPAVPGGAGMGPPGGPPVPPGAGPPEGRIPDDAGPPDGPPVDPPDGPPGG